MSIEKVQRWGAVWLPEEDVEDAGSLGKVQRQSKNFFSCADSMIWCPPQLEEKNKAQQQTSQNQTRNDYHSKEQDRVNLLLRGKWRNTDLDETAPWEAGGRGGRVPSWRGWECRGSGACSGLGCRWLAGWLTARHPAFLPPHVPDAQVFTTLHSFSWPFCLVHTPPALLNASQMLLAA